MTNEEFQKIMIEKLTELTNGQQELKQSLARIENDHGTKRSKGTVLLASD